MSFITNNVSFSVTMSKIVERAILPTALVFLRVFSARFHWLIGATNINENENCTIDSFDSHYANE